MWRKALRVLVWTVIVVAALCGLAYVFVEPWTVPGDDPHLAVSIEPTLSVGDVLLVTRGTGASDGALVRCADPDAAGRFVVGRVVGHSGDLVELTSGALIVNGKASTASVACDTPVVHLRDPTTQEDEDLTCMLEDFGGGLHAMLRSSKTDAGRDLKVEVEPGKAYLLSDNRAMHLDSRDFMGVVPSTCQRIVGRLSGAAGWFDAHKRLTVLW